jgi:hypothetical protein
MTREFAAASPPADHEPEWIALVREYVESLKFGVVQLVVHEGRVTQIERTEKRRLKPPDGPASAP